MSSWNDSVIEEFRTNDGVTKGWGKSLVVMHTIGARSGELRLAPVMGRRDGAGGWYAVASKGGAPTNPDWYYNLVAHPVLDVEAHIDGRRADGLRHRSRAERRRLRRGLARIHRAVARLPAVRRPGRTRDADHAPGARLIFERAGLGPAHRRGAEQVRRDRRVHRLGVARVVDAGQHVALQPRQLARRARTPPPPATRIA